MTLTAANYTHYSTITGCRVSTFSIAVFNAAFTSRRTTCSYYYRVSHRALSPSVTPWNYYLISPLCTFTSYAIHHCVLLWCITGRKRWISWWCSATEGEQRQGDKKKKDISAKILQTWLPLFRLQNEMQHHKFCLKWNRLIWICWPSTVFMCFGKATDNVQSRTTETCSISQQHRFNSHLVAL